jgi:hypothetical protein
VKVNVNMTIEEREYALVEALEECDRVMKDAYMKRAMKHAVLEKNGWCDFDLEKVLENDVSLSKEDVGVLIRNTNDT